jgi:calcineurin-like phosphoesterase family protein
MSETWFTSDHHFGHKNILTYEPIARPFKTIEEMHNVLIDRWNTVVGENDTVYYCGDFAFGKHNINFARDLRGQKKLIMGNHDTYHSREYLPYFYKLYGVVFWERCILSHVPVHPSQLGSRWMLNVHGHLHSKNIKTDETPILKEKDGEFFLEKRNDPRYFNVSVEQNNLTPINADIIRERLKELKEWPK